MPPALVAWNGRTNAGGYAPDGAYSMSVAPVDAAGNKGAAQERGVTVITGLRSVLRSTILFFPQDKDSLSKTDKLQFTLARPMTVSWTLRDAGGTTVITKLPEALPAGGDVLLGLRWQASSTARCCRAACTPPS